MKIGELQNRWRVTALAIAAVSALTAVGAQPNPGRYSAAAYASDGADVNSRLIIFPPDRREFSIPLPLTLRYVVYGASGQSLYATAFKRLSAKSFTIAPGLLKIELSPVRVNAISGLDAFDAIDRFAVSRGEDMILFEGTRSDAGGGTCGIFELKLPGGNPRPVLQTRDCRAGSPWRVYDVSPNMTEALIRTDQSLALLDLVNGKVTPLDGMSKEAAYSPDGKWIAAVDFGPGGWRTILIDREDLTRRRELSGSEGFPVAWSPDSRFLLQIAHRAACPGENPVALETVDIETGKRFTIKNSICNAGLGSDIGWVLSGIGR